MSETIGRSADEAARRQMRYQEYLSERCRWVVREFPEAVTFSAANEEGRR